jgi:hypothetical protein
VVKISLKCFNVKMYLLPRKSALSLRLIEIMNRTGASTNKRAIINAA